MKLDNFDLVNTILEEEKVIVNINHQDKQEIISLLSVDIKQQKFSRRPVLARIIRELQSQSNFVLGETDIDVVSDMLDRFNIHNYYTELVNNFNNNQER